jgi:hypothetical protein
MEDDRVRDESGFKRPDAPFKSHTQRLIHFTFTMFAEQSTPVSLEWR